MIRSAIAVHYFTLFLHQGDKIMSPMLDPEAHAWLNNLLAAIAAAEAGPIEADLAAAPKIELWLPLVSSSSFPALWGHVAGTESFITTSQLIHLDAEEG